MEILSKKKYKSGFYAAFVFIPFYAVAIWLAFNNVKFSVCYLLLGILLSICSFAFVQVSHKYVIAYGLILYVPIWYGFIIGNAISLIGFLSGLLPKYISISLPIAVVSFFFVLFWWSILRLYFFDIRKHKRKLLKGIDIDNGTIDAKDAIIASSDILGKHFNESPFWFIVKIIAVIGAPFGIGGAGLLAGKLLPHSVQPVIMIIALYSILIVFSGILSRWFFILLYIVHLQIKHRKWFTFKNAVGGTR